MVFLQTCLALCGNVPLFSLWCATLFRDIHTAVVAGNVLIWGNFRAKDEKFSCGKDFDTILIRKKPAGRLFCIVLTSKPIRQ
jgi:hypothetical protein